MIDYEKLKNLYDLAEKYSLQRCELGELRILISPLEKYPNRYFFDGIGFATLDGLIAKLTKLTQLKESK